MDLSTLPFIGMLDRVTGGRGEKALKYSMVSVVGVTLTQVMLAVYQGVLDWDPVVSNVASVSLTTFPVFVLNKRWVWRRGGGAHWRREVLPFWAFTVAGLGLSTGAVAIVDGWSDSILLVNAANLAGFGVLWVAKFLFLDHIMFGGDGQADVDDAVAEPA
jgi:putative flippase GtrA